MSLYYHIKTKLNVTYILFNTDNLKQNLSFSQMQDEANLPVMLPLNADVHIHIDIGHAATDKCSDTLHYTDKDTKPVCYLRFYFKENGLERNIFT